MKRSKCLRICAPITSILRDSGDSQTTGLSRSIIRKECAADISGKLKRCASQSWRSRCRSERKHEAQAPRFARATGQGGGTRWRRRAGAAIYGPDDPRSEGYVMKSKPRSGQRKTSRRTELRRASAQAARRLAKEAEEREWRASQRSSIARGRR